MNRDAFNYCSNTDFQIATFITFNKDYYSFNFF